MTTPANTDTTPRYAAYCAYLRMTFGDKPGEGPLNLCCHIVRDGMRCVGPFLDDHETDCGFWEPKPDRKRGQANEL